MISKLTKVLLLSASLLAAGTASATERSIVVPVIAGAAVGAVLATAISHSQRIDRPHYRPAPPPPRYQPVAYVPVVPQPHRFAPPPPRGHYDRHYDRGYDRGHDRGRGGDRW